jgi:SAM-dependent methyltransferase
MTKEKQCCYLCGANQLKLILVIDKKPDVEVDYQIPTEKYHREIFRCESCGVFNNFHDLIGDDFYEGFYNNSITSKPFQKRFERIIHLPIHVSDNKNRVKRVANFLTEQLGEIKEKKALDIGSGTCVFLYEIKTYGMHTTCIDPDPQAIDHAINEVKVDRGHVGSLENFESDTHFDLISFNKVLEHVKDPISNIKLAMKYLSENGILYIEMPEGESIFKEQQIAHRAEFAVEHYTIYNQQSMSKIADLCDLNLLKLESITDPSGKRTIYGFYEKR